MHSTHVDIMAARACQGTPASFDRAVAGATIVVTVRHPDYENEAHVFGNPITGVDIDLGRGFDVAHIDPQDWDQVLAWAVSLYQEADELPNSDAGLEAAEFIRSVAEDTLAQCLPYNDDARHCCTGVFIREAMNK